MSTSTYLAHTALQRVARAQAELERHLVADRSGHCLTCRQSEPCDSNRAANQTILSYGKLPRRIPGQTLARMPEPIRWQLPRRGRHAA